MPDSVRIVEVGPRDGLQNERIAVSVGTKLELIARLTDAGLAAIEVGSFVSPKRVPQMADTDQVVRHLSLDGPIRYPVLVPNDQGMTAALAAGVREIAVFASASETFSQKNINCSIADSIERFRPVVDMAKANDVAVRGYVSCVLGCPYEGAVAVTSVVSVSRRLVDLGCYEISLGDTIGIGTPRQAQSVVRAVAGELDVAMLAAHFHDTRGQAPGAAGNVSTEDLLFMLHGMGISTGVDLDRIVAAGHFIAAALGRPSGSKVAQSMAVDPASRALCA
jgi:isopropylmalate/homocitrate/citramalate synthase